MRKFLFILLALVIAMSSINAQAQKRKRTTKKRAVTTKVETSSPAAMKSGMTKELKTEKDGYQWYLVKQGNLYGAQDKSGKKIILTEYDNIYCYSEKGETSSYRYFTARKGDYYALYYPNGKCPISIDRRYGSLFLSITANKAYIVVARSLSSGDIGFGICDMDGIEVISPISKSYPFLQCAFNNNKICNYYYFEVKEDLETNGLYHIVDLNGNIVKKNRQLVSYDNEKGYYYCMDAEYNEERISINQNSRYNFNHVDGVTSFYGSILPAPRDPQQGSYSEGGPGGKKTDKPKPTPQPKQQVRVWKSCTYCMGSGICSYCNGWGVKGYGTKTVLPCPSCPGNGRCIFCNGAKGHYEYEWR